MKLEDPFGAVDGERRPVVGRRFVARVEEADVAVELGESPEVRKRCRLVRGGGERGEE